MRRKSREVLVGGIGIGGENPIRIQSMTNTRTEDVVGTVEQIMSLARAGSELVRITVNTPEAAKAVPYIAEELYREGITVPLIGDFHYNGHTLLQNFSGCAEALDKYRINPGNSRRRKKGEKTGFEQLIEIAIAKGKAVRIGVNSGSLDREVKTRLMDANAKYAIPRPAQDVEVEAAVLSLVESAEEAEKIGLPHNRIIVSVKLSSVSYVLKANRMLAELCDYPIHLGLTEAGPGADGVVASASALAILLEEGIGDTIRASLTPGPDDSRTTEVAVCKSVLQSLGLRHFAPKITACPGCGRAKNEFYLELTDEVKQHVALHSHEWKRNFPGSEELSIAVMGCVVNGPGESKHADIGISLPGGGEEPRAQVFADGKLFATLSGENIAPDFIAILEKYIENRFLK